MTTTQDVSEPADGKCSLREAVATVEFGGTSGPAAGECVGDPANGSNIVVPAGTYIIREHIYADWQVLIQGAGPGQTILKGEDEAYGANRVLWLGLSSAISFIRDLTISGGHARDGGDGADGADVAPGAPGDTGETGGDGDHGGAIYNEGHLKLSNVVFSDNHAGDGGSGGRGGTGGSGALAANGTAGDGGDGAPGSPGGSGGAIFNIGVGTLELYDVTFSGNTAGDGGAGGAGGVGGGTSFNFNGIPSGDGGDGAEPGFAGSGGAIFSRGRVFAAGVTFVGNSAGRGGRGGDQGFPGTQRAGNPAGAYGVGAYGADGGDGGALHGGLVANVVNATVTANRAGAAGAPGQGWPGGSASSNGPGSGIYLTTAGIFDPPVWQFTNITLADNKGRSAFRSAGESAVVRNSIFAGNTELASAQTSQCHSALLVDGGHNVVFPADAQCPAGFQVGDPKLRPLADNGGRTQTRGLGDGSAALDLVPATGSGCPVDDQRGLPRPFGGACDAGAYEAAPPSATTGEARGVTGDKATLTGTIDSAPTGGSTYHFEYFAGSQFAETPETNTQGAAPVPVEAAIAGLAPDTSYSYRIVVTSPDGSAAGEYRTFTTAGLPAPTLTGTSPASPVNNNNPRVIGTAPPGTIVLLYTTSSCTGVPAAVGTEVALANPGLLASVPDNSVTTFYGIAVHPSGKASPCSTSSVTYTESSPGATLSKGGAPSSSLQGSSVVVSPGITAACPAGAEGCTAEVVATVPGATAGAARKPKRKPVVVGRARVAIAPGKTRPLRFRLNRRGMKLLKKRARLRMTVAVSTRVGAGAPVKTTKSIAVKRPGKKAKSRR